MAQAQNRSRTVKAPKRPSAPKRPAARVASVPSAKRPGRPRKAETIEAPAAGKPSRPGLVKAPRPDASAPAVAKRGGNEANLLDQIATLKTSVATLTEQLAAAKARYNAKQRSLSDITEGAPIAEGDWRKSYHGHIVQLYRCTANRDGDLTVHTDDDPIPCLLAMPRTSDLGGKGDNARAGNLIAVHWSFSESGETITAPPVYVNEPELAELWAE